MKIQIIVKESEVVENWDVPLIGGSGKSRVAQLLEKEKIGEDMWFTYKVLNKTGIPQALRVMRQSAPSMTSTAITY